MRARILLVLLLAWTGGAASRDAAAAATAPTSSPTVRDLAAARGASFLENGGRMDAAADFTVESPDRTFFFGPGAVTVALRDPATPERGRWTLRLAFDGADASVRPSGEGERPWRTHLFRGKRAAWRTDLRSYEGVVYRDLWPGVDLVWRGDDAGIKWEAVVAPGADPSCVRIRVEGAERTTIGADGSLRAETPLGDLVDAAPVASQDGESVAVAYALEGDVLSFNVGAYDASRAILLDPAIFIRTGILGGSFDDAANSVATDVFGATYLTGTTKSPETTFPAATGPDPTYNRGPEDAFVAKIGSNFVLAWCGYLGGTGDDAATGVIVDSLTNVTVCGRTTSADFPSTGIFSGVHAGNWDVFLTRLRPDGRMLTWSGTAGGAGDDRANGLAAAANGQTIVVGRSTGGMPFGSIHNGMSDGFVMSVRSDGQVASWGRYVGGAQSDEATAVAVGPQNQVYVCGNTSSVDFPTNLGPGLVPGGLQDAFVAKIDPVTTSLVYAGYVAGASVDEASAIAVDDMGRAVVGGSTRSTEFMAPAFPVAGGPDPSHNGKIDGFVARVAADGLSLEACGFVGGTGDDFVRGIVIDPQRRPIVVGVTGSTQSGYLNERSLFPVVDGPDLTFGGGVHDGFVGMLPTNFAPWLSLGYVGGSGNVDDCNAVARRSTGEVVVAGVMASSAKTFPAGSGPGLKTYGGRDAFVCEVLITWDGTVLPLTRPTLDSVQNLANDVQVFFTDQDVNEASFEVQRTTQDGSSVTFSLPSATTQTTGAQVMYLDTTASPGTQYAWRVRASNPATKSGWTEPIVISTMGGLDLKVKSAVLRGAGTPGAGKLSLKTKFTVQPGAPAAPVAPPADGMTVLIQGAGPDQTIVVPPNDPGWVVAGNKVTWTGNAPGATTIAVDLFKRSIRVDAQGLSFDAPTTAVAPLRIAIRMGPHYASRSLPSRAKGKTYRAP